MSPRLPDCGTQSFLECFSMPKYINLLISVSQPCLMRIRITLKKIYYLTFLPEEKVCESILASNVISLCFVRGRILTSFVLLISEPYS
jgi:hypothetical protein